MVRAMTQHASFTRRFKTATAVAVAGASLLAVTGAQVAGTEVAAKRPSDTGFSSPFSGSATYEYLTPTQATHPSQINEPLGQERADFIAATIGLDKDKVLTTDQYQMFIQNEGVPGSTNQAAVDLANRSVAIFINTNGNPLQYVDDNSGPKESVLASYGLFVNPHGVLESLANPNAATRLANVLLEPDGYINSWFLANGADEALLQLYQSAYTVEALFGNEAQGQSDPFQLVTNIKRGSGKQTVGMSMAPALWMTNFALLYTLNPTVAAEMPGFWAPIPKKVAKAIYKSDSGQIPYSEYAQYFE
jgi:hypothetical protein